jgi:hypothetical protein
VEERRAERPHRGVPSCRRAKKRGAAPSSSWA